MRAIKYKGKLYTPLYGANSIEGEIEDVDAKLEKAVEALREIAKAKLEYKPTSEDSMGNYDDVFRDGISLGEHYQAEIASEALASLEPKEGA